MSKCKECRYVRNCETTPNSNADECEIFVKLESDFKVVLPRTTEEWQRDMNFAYEKGRADKDKELSELPNPYSEKLWENAYNIGRANAIDEFAEKMKPIAIKWFTYGCMYLGDIDTLAEQLKEQK